MSPKSLIDLLPVKIISICFDSTPKLFITLPPLKILKLSPNESIKKFLINISQSSPLSAGFFVIASYPLNCELIISALDVN